ncbi:MAG: hypothetical protein WAV07_01465 [Candidatus Contendobacter sp.]
MNWVALLLDCGVAVIGGCLGAALSALGGFLLFGLLGVLGFLYLLVANSDIWIGAVTGSALLKPSVCFVGGVVATAYARKKGLIQCGKDIGRSFLSYRRFDILAVGGCAGLAGYLVNRSADALFAGTVDTIAFTVFLVPLFIKYHWHMIKTNDCEASSHAIPSPYRFFEKFSRPRGKTLASLVIGLCTSLLTFGLFLVPETKPYAGLLVFCISAVFLFPLFMGIPIPATHHFSGPAGAATMVWLSSHGGSLGGWGLVLMTLWGIAAAQIGLLGGDIMERLFFTEGDIHIDPPAMGIFVATAIMLGGLPLTGVYSAGAWVQIIVSLSMIIAALIFNLREKRSQPQAVQG